MTLTEMRPDSVPGKTIAGRGPWALAWARIRTDRVALTSAVVVVVLLVLAAAAPLVAQWSGHAPDDQFRDIGITDQGLPVPPNGTFWFGTDRLGRDLFVRVLYGARVSLMVGVLSTVLAAALGVAVGLLAGFYGGVVDTLLSRLMDVVLSFPYLIFAIAVVSIAGPSLTATIGVIAFYSWAAIARIVRGQTLSIKEREYIEAARSLGASDTRIMFIDILPNLLAPVIVLVTLLIPAAIVFESTLSYLGLGITPPTPSWGNLLSEAQGFYRVAWWYLTFPAGALLLTTLAFNLLGDGIRDAIDPRTERLFSRRRGIVRKKAGRRAARATTTEG
ncbi:peptide ABC transporter permease [Sphaerisporangium siamense]|uniref:Peptide/nickel transport system permease protein n=1 Tax=Sphaerisporangium siamense TaxID=795645 RepID=A0A7W7DIB3_9ACTN|nr:ABC transporter permease [Sphaerisporangium siamense]MBB4705858.1 peptide/nickel transport system permease protein [Sphaerisporangium siamense]GII82748.1 peptide ABC transporter permease [Sphaerisporangium siamense]